MEIQLFNSIFFWKKYFKDLLKIFFIELKEKFYYNYLKLIILYPGLCSIFLIITINIGLGVSHVPPEPELKVYFFTNSMQTYMSTALSLASFEPNPEYLYLYRLERKIELINALIQKITEKTPTHLNLDLQKTRFVNVKYLIHTAVHHYSQLYSEFLYNFRFPLGTEVIKFDSGEHECQEIFIRLLETMLGKGSVRKKFDFALKAITIEGSPMLDKRAKYDCKLLFDPYIIQNKRRDLRGLTTFSEGFKNYSYVDLCVLDFYISLIASELVSHYWILPEDTNIVGNAYWTLGGAHSNEYSIYMNGSNFHANTELWERSKTLPDLIIRLLEIYIKAMTQEDSYRLATMTDMLMFKGRGSKTLQSYFVDYTHVLMTILQNGLFKSLDLKDIETFFLFEAHTEATMLINDLRAFIIYGR
jgi:hypothetical protein